MKKRNYDLSCHGMNTTKKLLENENSTGLNKSHRCKFNQVKVQNASSFQEKKKTSLFSISVTFMYLEIKIHLN